MAKLCVLFLAALVSGFAAGEERRSPAAVPQPRVRLDPNTRTAIPPSKKSEQESSGSVHVMSPMVIKSTILAAEDPQQEQQPEGLISPLHGGYILKKTRNKVQFEVGVWPYHNILWKADRFKSDLKHVGTEFLRVRW